MAHVRRRQFLTAAAALLAAPRIARAQAPKRLPVLGLLVPGRKPPPDTPINPFGKRLEELGWIEGKTLVIERAYAEGDPDRLPELAAMLAAKNVDVIWAVPSTAAVAAARATTTIPIVFWYTALPIELGLIDSFARPGRNVTGTAWTAGGVVEIHFKQAQLLREIAPNVRRLALLPARSSQRTVKGDMYDTKPNRDSVDAAVRGLGFEVRWFVLQKAADFEDAFAAVVKWGADSLLVLPTDLTSNEGKRIVDFARRHRLPDAHSFATVDPAACRQSD